MLRHRLIEPSQLEWASSVVFTPKKGGTYLFSVDYRRLNAMMVTDSYPINEQVVSAGVGGSLLKRAGDLRTEGRGSDAKPSNLRIYGAKGIDLCWVERRG